MRKRSEVSTIPPSFDLNQYAKDSDRHLTAAAAFVPDLDLGHPAPKSEVRLSTRPYGKAIVSDEAWARSMLGTPSIAISSDQLKRLPLGHRAGFLLSQLDGGTDLETLIELSAMPRDETLRLMRDLFERGVVTFR